MNKIFSNVKLGKNSTVLEPCVLGLPPTGKKDGELELMIGENSLIRPFATIYAGAKIGKKLETGQYSMIREDNVIGDNLRLGSFSELGPGNEIGNNVFIQSGCFLERVIVKDWVFIGPNVVFTDDFHPVCKHYKECCPKIVVEAKAKIGANVTICPGVKIGENALIGAGAVVTKDVPARAVVVGNPARVVKTIDDLECKLGKFPKAYAREPYL